MINKINRMFAELVNRNGRDAMDWVVGVAIDPRDYLEMLQEIRFISASAKMTADEVRAEVYLNIGPKVSPITEEDLGKELSMFLPWGSTKVYLKSKTLDDERGQPEMIFNSKALLRII